LKKNKKKKGSIPIRIRKLTNEIQFFCDLKILIREKASDQSCFEEGTIRRSD